MLLSVKLRVYNTHPEKGIILGYRIKRGQATGKLITFHYMERMRKWHSPPMSQILTDTLT